MTLINCLLAGAVALLAGLDRTAMWQFMLSRPIVAAPLAGLLLGDGLAGLQVGALVELLWLGRLPVGAAIPPDDTQVAVGSTLMAVAIGSEHGIDGWGASILCVLVAMPLGKVGQFFDRWAREANGRLLERATLLVEEGRLDAVERCHLRGLVHFAAASLATFAVIVVAGSLVVVPLAPQMAGMLREAEAWTRIALPLAGTAIILGTVNVSRAMTLFGASFSTALLMLWLL